MRVQSARLPDLRMIRKRRCRFSTRRVDNRCLRKFSTRCVENSTCWQQAGITEIKLLHVKQILGRPPSPVCGRKLFRKLRHQFQAVLGPMPALLLFLDNLASDQPVCYHLRGIDRADHAGASRFQNLANTTIKRRGRQWLFRLCCHPFIPFAGEHQ